MANSAGQGKKQKLFRAAQAEARHDLCSCFLDGGTDGSDKSTKQCYRSRGTSSNNAREAREFIESSERTM